MYIEVFSLFYVEHKHKHARTQISFHFKCVLCCVGLERERKKYSTFYLLRFFFFLLRMHITIQIISHPPSQKRVFKTIWNIISFFFKFVLIIIIWKYYIRIHLYLTSSWMRIYARFSEFVLFYFLLNQSLYKRSLI